MNEREYAGFWIRTAAALIDTVFVLLIMAPLLSVIFGAKQGAPGSSEFILWDVLINSVFQAVAIIVFWVYKSATPGKMITRISIVDANTGAKPSTGQFIGRYLGYYVSMIPLMLGIIWIAFDPRKRGWHDLLASTVVVHNRPTSRL
jgi:uncharacterized RDD family membrane protein YckC